jgi:alpha-galactosidase
VPFRIPDLAAAPPMGWNSFDSYGVHLDEAAALTNLRVMARRLGPAGYRVFAVDMGWYSEYESTGPRKFPMSADRPRLCMDAFGRYVPSARLFPSGLASLADRVHAHDMLLGLHIMRGIPRGAVERNLPIEGTEYRAADIADREDSCSWNDFNYGVVASHPGARKYYESFLRLIASWGVDFVKVDDIVEHPNDIELIADAIEAQQRPMMLSLSPGNVVDYGHVHAFRRANMVRLTRDVWDRRICIDRGFEAWAAWHKAGCSGFWPDLDMIPIGHLRLCLSADNLTPGARMPSEGMERDCQWSRDQRLTFLTMLGLAASPLFMGGDLVSAGDDVFELLTCKGLIACNQSVAPGERTWQRSGVEVWAAQSRAGDGRRWAGVFNRSEREPARLCLSEGEHGLATGTTKDIWSGRDVRLPGEVWLPPDGVVLLRCDRAG